MGFLALFTRLINTLTALAARSSLRQLDRLEAIYRSQSDEDLRAALRTHLRHEREQQAGGLQRLAGRWLFRYHETSALHALAIAVCLFDRHPCDLPEGSTAYDEQRLAALSLVEGQNVQMDTGEGKTYAIALAAVALLAEYPQVMIVTANDYLARRDLARVLPFLSACGLSSGHGAPSSSFRGVSYLTMETVCFEYINRTYGDGQSELDYPAGAAVIIDEIDSVLLDSDLDHSLARRLPTDPSLWRMVFGFIETMPADTWTYDPIRDRVSLDAEAWNLVARLGAASGKPVSLLIDLVTAALWAQRAQEGRNYAVSAGEILLINRVTGLPYKSSGSYSSALEYLVLGRNLTVSLGVAEVNGLTLLSRHRHVVGLSGTASDDTLYFLQVLGSLTAQVPPKFPRAPGRIETLLSPSREDTFAYVTERIGEVAPRPVVIGTWSPEEALAVGAHLAAAGITGLAVITAFDSEVDQGVLDAAGEQGRVTVMSQGGSRGVDVRSRHRPLLIVLGRAYEPRLDRQFLGRVGRHGEPFDAEFVLDPNSPIWNKVLAFNAATIGIVPLPRPAARSLRVLQHDHWTFRTQTRQRDTLLTRAIGEAEQAMAGVFARARRLTGPEPWPAYVAELVSEGGEGGDGAGGGRGAGPALAALERRELSDAPVLRFEAAAAAASLKNGRVQRLSRGPAGDIVKLSAWMERRSAELADGGDRAGLELFRRQVDQAVAQRLPAPTSPHWRGPRQVVYETLLMANATMYQQIRRRLAALWVSSSVAVYYRRGAYTVHTVDQLSRFAIRQELLKHLARVDQPELLDELFFSYENMVSGPSGRPAPVRFELSAPPPARDGEVGTKAGPTAEALVATFLAAYAKRPGGLPIPEQSARVLLLAVLQPFVGVPGAVTGPLLRRQVDMVLHSLAAAGLKGAALRDHERLVEALLASLHQQGVLPVPLPRPWRATRALGRAWSFASTVSRLGLLAIGALALVFAAAVLIPGPQGRHFAIADTATSLFGFGALAPGRPLLALFALIVVTYLVTRAARHPNPLLVLPRFAPVLALGLTLVLYSRGLANLAPTLQLLVLLVLWAAAFFAAERFVATMVGVQAVLVVGAASVAAFAVTAVVRGTPALLAPLAIGVAAAAAGGPPIPVSIGSSSWAAGRFSDADERARVRVPLDPTLVSCLVAAVLVTLTVGTHGWAALLTFAAVQVVAFGLLAWRRLDAGQVEGVLAKLRVGTPLDSAQLAAHLRRGLVASVALAGVVMVGGVWLAAALGTPSIAAVALAEWAGVLLVEGVMALGNAVSVSGVASPFLRDSDGGPSLREQLKSWRQLRFAKVIRVGLILLVLVKPLEWLDKWIGLGGVAQTVWRWLTSLF